MSSRSLHLDDLVEGSCHRLFDWRKFWDPCEVAKFWKVDLVVVEFLTAITISDVTKALILKGKAVFLPTRHSGVRPRRLWLLEKWEKTSALIPGVWREFTEIEKCRIEIQQADDPITAQPLLDFRPSEYERNVGAALPEGVFLKSVFLPEVVSVVRPKDDDGIRGISAGGKRVQNPADLMVNEADTGKVGVEDVAPLIRFDGPLGARHVLENTDLLRNFRHIMEIVFPVGGEGECLLVIKIEPFLRRIPRYMRSEEADHEEEGALVLRLELFDCPRGCLMVR